MQATGDQREPVEVGVPTHGAPEGVTQDLKTIFMPLLQSSDIIFSSPRPYGPGYRIYRAFGPKKTSAPPRLCVSALKNQEIFIFS